MAVGKVFDYVRVAHAIAIIKTHRRSSDTQSELHWKKKAKLLKEEISALRQELRDVEADGSTLDKLPSLAPCECFFLNTPLKELQIARPTDADEQINKLSVQRFLKNVRILSRAKENSRRRQTGNFKVENCGKGLKEHLALVVNFIVELLADPAPSQASDSKSFSTYVHQSVKFVTDAMPHLLEDGGTQEFHVVTAVDKLASTFSMNIMSFSSMLGVEGQEVDKRVWNQQIILQLGSVPYIGQKFLLTISRVIAEIAETMVCVDPFHDGVAQTYDNLFFMLQLFERLLSDHLYAWAKTADLDEGNLEEAVRYHFQTVNLFQTLGNWSSLVAFYTNRITGEIITQLYKIEALSHKAEGSKHSALLHLVESATSTIHNVENLDDHGAGTPAAHGPSLRPQRTSNRAKSSQSLFQ